ncbi:MAG: prepilin-type N-terminal cleavage/methylation domain-containing protein [Myxococcales bacterium]|nr:prepilin-type N-terminal cleavage/methylation domain-containing protein [Myxococcales bacterium]
MRGSNQPIRMPRARRAGFTLLELMVALVAALIVISAVYSLGINSTREFHTQQRIGVAQQALRVAMTQIRRDIGRAALFTDPVASGASGDICTPLPVANFQAVWIKYVKPGDAANLLPNSVANQARADELRLVGDMSTSDRYLVERVSGNSVVLQPEFQAFRRSFTFVDGMGAQRIDAGRFNSVFRAGRLVRFDLQNGRSAFGVVDTPTADLTSPSFTVTVALTQDACTGNFTGASVAPISIVQYLVEDPRSDAELANVVAPAGSFEAGLPERALVRRELAFDNAIYGATPTVVQGTTRVILDYVADVRYAVRSLQAAGAAPNNIVRFVDDQAEAETDNNPAGIRSVIVGLSAMTAEQDPNMSTGVTQPTGGPPLYYVPIQNTLRAGAARVRSLSSEVFLPNMHVR